MTLMDIVKEYDEILRKRKGRKMTHYELKGEEYYFFNDMRKKLDTVLFYLGLPDLEFLKGENWRNYSFEESEKEYIIHLLDIETSRLFRNLKKGKKGERYLKEDDYKEYIKEIEKLHEFIKNRVKDKPKFIEIMEGIYSKTQYPQLKFYYNELRPFEENCLRSFISKVEYPSIAYWEELYVEEQLFLLKKLRGLIRKWEEIVCEITEIRHDEIMDGIEKLPELKTYSLVNILEAEKKLRLEKQLKEANEKEEILKKALEKRENSEVDELTEEEKTSLKEYDESSAKKKSIIEKIRKGNNKENTLDILSKEIEEFYDKEHRYVKEAFFTSVEIEEKIQQSILFEKEKTCKENNLDFEIYLKEEKELEQTKPKLTSAIALYEEAIEKTSKQIHNNI